MRDLQYGLGQYCRDYRMSVLKMTLKEVSGEHSVKNLSAFEHGRSSNLTYMFLYLSHIKTEAEKKRFMNGIIEVGNAHSGKLV